jgi:hypothetical protein
MIKFIHREHAQEEKGSRKIVIYYSISDIFLGTALLLLVAFFIHDYISQRLTSNRFYGVYTDAPTPPQLSPDFPEDLEVPTLDVPLVLPSG